MQAPGPGTPRRVRIATSAGPARAELDAAGDPPFLLVLTHGAGGGTDSADLLAARQAGLDVGAAVARVLQPYRVRGARAPGSAARQDEAWLEIIGRLRRRFPGVPLVQGGRSNGARVACRTGRPAPWPCWPWPSRCTRPAARTGHGRLSWRRRAPRCLSSTAPPTRSGSPKRPVPSKWWSCPAGPTRWRARAARSAAWSAPGSPGCGRVHRPERARLPECGRPVRGDDLAAGKQLTGVLEHHDAVAEQGPALLGVAGDGAGRFAVDGVCFRALRRVRAHGCASWSGDLVVLLRQRGRCGHGAAGRSGLIVSPLRGFSQWPGSPPFPARPRPGTAAGRSRSAGGSPAA